jgi:hypothetical protein
LMNIYDIMSRFTQANHVKKLFDFLIGIVYQFAEYFPTKRFR